MEKCQLLTDWIKEFMKGETKECRSCGMATLVGVYHGILDQKGYRDKAERITDIATSEDEEFLLKLAREMDRIKEEVDKDTKIELHQIDCEVERATKEEAEG